MKRTVTQDGPPASRYRPSRSSKSMASKSFKRYRTPPGGPGIGSVHTICKTAIGQVLTTDGGFQIGITTSDRWSMQFNLQQAFFNLPGGASRTLTVPGYAELSALWDQVMVDKVVVKFYFSTDPATSVPPGGAYAPQGSLTLYHAIDYNDAAVPAAQTDIQQYSSVKSRMLAAELGPIVRVVKPKFAQVIYASAVGNSYRASRGFLQSATDVPHYGLKGFVTTPSFVTGNVNQGTMLIECKYFYKCMNTV